MANKTVDFVSNPTKILASQIADFYNRLNALRALGADPQPALSNTAPSIGTHILPDDIVDIRDAIINTKNDMTFLHGTNINTFKPVIPEEGQMAKAQTVIHPLEWQIGQLESACFTNFTTNRTSVNLTNFSSNNLPDNTVCVTFNSSNNATIFTTQRVANTPICSTVFTAQRQTNKTAQRATNKTAQRATNFTTRFKTYFQTFRHYVHTSFNSGHGCNTFGTQFKPVQRTVYSSFFQTQYTANFAVQYTANFAVQYTANYSTVFSPVFSVQYTSFNPGCPSNFTVVYKTNKSTNKTSNRAANFDSNFTSNTTTFYANHVSFTVTPLP